MTLARSASAATSEVEPASNGLVSPEWLAVHLSDPDLRVVEVDVSSAAYEDWHIEDAVLWNIYRDLKGADYRPVDTLGLEEVLQRSGISADTKVVLYGYAPAFGLWLLESYGHDDVRILNCNRDAWKTAGWPCTDVVAFPSKSEYTLDAVVAGQRSTRPDIEVAIGSTDTVLLDVRSTAEYGGERFWPSGGTEPGGRAGHIPSAVHQPLEGLYNSDGSFRPVANLRDAFSAVDADGPKPLITYCTIGGRAATAWFVLTHLLGRPNVSVYDGSWAEWGRLPDTPIETITNQL